MHGGVWILFNDVFYLRKNVWSGSFDNKKKGAGHRGDRSGDSGQWQRVRDYFKRMILCARNGKGLITIMEWIAKGVHLRNWGS